MAEHENSNVTLFPLHNTLKQKLYCIADYKSLTFLPPFLAQNDDEAKRNFIQALNYSNTSICKFPEDFKLLCISDFIVAFTGDKNTAKPAFEKQIFDNYTIIASGEDCIQPDTNKYTELSQKVDNALKQVSNSNNVLVQQIGDVPNLEKAINVLTSKLTALEDKFNHYVVESDKLLVSSKKGILNSLFK